MVSWRRAALLAALLLSACASYNQEKKNTAELATLTVWLPGTYENGPKDITLKVTRVDAQHIGKNVFYAEESASNDPNRIETQRLFYFQVDEQHGTLIETIYKLNEPARWREGGHDKELFDAILPDDVHSIRGCQLLWIKTSELYSGVRSHGCHDTSGLTTDKAWLTDQALTLGLVEYKKVE
jgi:CpeT/CpcT family (DUF1001)